ncbi:hypothetical protein DB346_08250 [Verrucomicrobia bacterium LW23]|nr:hypothetical protein DB346_08250 [Verrucomicrobia bacterium LW23]
MHREFGKCLLGNAVFGSELRRAFTFECEDAHAVANGIECQRRVIAAAQACAERRKDVAWPVGGIDHCVRFRLILLRLNLGNNVGRFAGKCGVGDIVAE